MNFIPPQIRSKWLLSTFLTLLLVGIVYAWVKRQGVDFTGHQISVSATATPISVDSPLPSSSPSPPSIEPVGVASGSPTPLDLTVDADGLSRSTVTMTTSKGTLKFKFYSKDAPNTVKRVADLIQSGFYDGLTFHRVVPDFVVQGGDPQGTGRGGSGTKLKAEFNPRHHLEGTVAMARTSDPNSADSQFYIALRALPQLDNNYTVIGQVIDGLDVLHQLQKGDKMLAVRIH